MRGGIPVVPRDGLEQPQQGTFAGEARTQDQDTARLLAALLLEMKAVRVGLELALNLQPGELIDHARNA